MRNQLIRSTLIFALALSLTLSFLKIHWFENHWSGKKREEAVAQVYARMGSRVRHAALRLQGLIVKVGQFLSTRTDIFPLSFTRELSQLQDSVPGVSFDKIRPLLESELGANWRSIFLEFAQEPVAAASLGQVHRATMHNGQVVAVKILRPGIERLARIDLSSLAKIIWILYRFTKFGKRMNLPSLYEQFSDIVHQELDYRQEADHLRRFAKQFAADERIVVPRILAPYATQRLLTMDYIEGIKLTDTNQMSICGISHESIVEILLDAYLNQILIYGFIHVDPHPGNLLILPDGKLCFLDFGMMSELPAQDVQYFSKLVTAAMLQDLDGIVEAIDNLGFLQPNANKQFLKRAVRFLLDRLSGMQLKRGEELNTFITDFQNFLHEEPIILQAKYMFLGRAVGILSGIVTSLTPGINWMAVLQDRVLPLLNARTQAAHDASSSSIRSRLQRVIENLFGETQAMTANLILDQAQTTAMALIRLPTELDKVLQRIDRGDTTIRLELSEVLTQLELQERLVARATWGIFACASGFSGLWLQTKAMVFESHITFILTGLFTVMTLFNIWSYRRMKRKHLRHFRRS